MSQTLDIFQAALAAVDPFRLTMTELQARRDSRVAGPREFDLGEASDIVVVGAGKAAAGMGLAAEAVLGGRISRGLLVLPRGSRAPFRTLGQAQGAHPIPDREGERASGEILRWLEKANERTRVICLLSGGASALLAAPAAGVTLADKGSVTSQLLRAGAAIGEVNAVRKHLSAVKGGRLAAAAFPAPILTLALSDVIDDAPDVIGSGPTVADPTTFAMAWAVVEKYGLSSTIPVRARDFLRRGMAGREAETVKANDPRLARSTHRVIGNNALALEGARQKAEALGWPATVAAAPLRGEARDAARGLAAAARRTQATLKPGERRCLLSGGETTVTVRGGGRGGRNQELALAFALAIAGTSGIEMLAAGSDGLDGASDAAGAIVDGRTVERAARLGLDAAAALADNDSHFFFAKLDRLGGERIHVKTGPTGTNVMDVQVVLVEAS